jgi:peptidoglycan hydrolase-like protein with peptidoglycan-binding domain
MSTGNATGHPSVVKSRSAILLTWRIREITLIRKFALGTASVLALGIGGAALEFVASADDYANAASISSQHWINTENLSKDDIRWAQVELHTIGRSFDGVAGPETKRALLEFQEDNGLDRTATLDQQTADALVGHTGVGRVSSMPPKGAGGG